MPKPRAPGLWMVDGDDKKQVLDARKHLLDLLDDPYYFEAYQRLRKERHSKLNGLKGRRLTDTNVGALARGLQCDWFEPDTGVRHDPGRPRDAFLLSLNFDQFRARLEAIPGGSLKTKCRQFVQACRRTDDQYLEEFTDWLYNKVRSNKRNSQ